MDIFVDILTRWLYNLKKCLGDLLMKKHDLGEFHNTNQYNDFSEYKPFRAEQYYSQEAAKPPQEAGSYDESYNNEGVKATKNTESESTDVKELQKQYDKINSSNSSESGEPTSSTSGANSTQGANTTSATSTTSASGATTSASTATGGAAATVGGATAAAAIVIVSAVITGGFITDFNSHIGNDVGMDYVSISVSMDELLSQADKSYDLKAGNFSIELTEGDYSRKIQLEDGKHCYLITGLQPAKTYTYNLICNNPPLGVNSNCYSSTFTTLGTAEPKGVYDELNSYVTYDEATQSATVGYSIYLSDYEGVYDNYTFYICSTEQTDVFNVNHVIYTDQSLGEDNYFKGEAVGVTYNELYLYVVGENVGEDSVERAELFSLELTLQLPEEWQTAKNPAFEIDEGAEDITLQPDSIYISGRLTDFNQNFTYYAYVTQYGKEGTALIERQEVGLISDPENMTYSINGEAYFGVNKFKYVIYTYDESENEIVVYDSGEKQFTVNQGFGATYTKVEPSDATIEYTSSGVTITANTGFASEYGNYEYKLVVTNSSGKVFGQYQGTGKAVFEITDFADLDEINFTYYDIGQFADGEVEFASHPTEGVAFCMPAITLDSEYGFDGQNFTLSYFCDMIYDYTSASMDIEVTTADGTPYTKHVDSVSEKGIITLDNIQGQPGNVTVKATLNFNDYQSDGAVHSLELAQAEYAMNYSFEVSKVVADVSGFSTEAMAVTLNFNSLLPNGYKIKITDEANSIDLTSDLTNEYSISDLAMDTEYNLTVQVTDADGNAWGAPKTVNISKTAAEAEYTSPTMSSPNPGDAVVTYNDDGTINIYRQMIPDAYGRDTVSDDERVYYNAYIYAGYYDAEYNFTQTQAFDVIGRGKYAAIENIPKDNYIFTYYKMFDYNGVSYVMYGEMPSGSVETVYDCGTAVATVANGQTTININISQYGKLANKILVNGTEYTYTTYTDEKETNPTLVIEGEIDVTEVTIFFTSQGGNYDTYSASGEITMKGSKYGEYTVTVSAVEA